MNLENIKNQINAKLEGRTFEQLVWIWDNFTKMESSSVIEDKIMDKMAEVDEERFIEWA